MRKLLSILLTAVFLLQLAPFPAHGEAGPAEHEETETDTLREYAALLEDEEEVVGSFLCAYVMNSWDDLGPTVYISLYDQNDDYVDDPGGEFQYLWYYNSRGVSWGSCEDITPVGLTAAAWSALGGTDAVDSCVNCTKSAAPFFLRDEVRSAVDPLWTSDPHRPAFTTDDIDTSQYTEGGSDGEEEIPRSILMEEMDPEGGAEAFCAYVGVIVRWRESSESEWSFYAATDPDYGTERVDLQPGADYVPVFSAAPPYAGYPADCFTGQDAMTYISVEVSYPFGEIAYQWYKTDGESYDGAALEGETEDYMRVPYPNEPGADHYYCEVTYSFRDLEPGLWRSPIIPVIRTEAEGFWAELRPFSIYRGEITSSYPQRGSGSTMSNTPFQVVNQNEYNSYGLYDAYFHTAVGDTATISVYLRPASSRKTFTHCDRFTYEWYWSDRESERGDLIGSGSVEGLDAFSNDPISVGKADYSLLNQAANIHVNPPTDRAGLFYLTFTGTVHYGEYTYEESTTQTVLVLEDPMELFDFDPDTGDLSRYTGCSDELVIPAEIHGVPVKSFTLGMRTTAYTPAYTGVRKVTLPEGLEKIGYNCFYKLASLEECNIPSTVTEIGANAFSGTELSAVQFGADCFPLMGNGAFSKMQYLTRVVLPQNAQGRLSGTGTFADCPNLLQVQNYGQILDPDPSDDFKGTPALSRMLNGAEDDGTLYYEKNEAGTGYIVTGFLRETARVTIPDTFRELPVVAVENSAFENCSVITEVTVGTGVTEIRDRAFRGCANLRSLTLSEGLETIGANAFCGTALEALTFPSTLRTIGDGAFRELLTLTEADFSQAASLACIGQEAFAHDEHLASAVILPSGVLVREKAFYFCVSIPAVTVEGCRLENASFHWCTSLDSITGSWIRAYPDVAAGQTCYYDNFLFAKCLKVTTDHTMYRRMDAGYEPVDTLYYNNRETYVREGNTAYVLGTYDEYKGKWYGAYYLDLYATDLYISGTLEWEGETVIAEGLLHSMFDEMRSTRWNITVGEGIENIECYGYGSIASFQFPGTVKRFRDTLFHYSPGMRTFGSPYLTEITLPASLTDIPTEAFADCVNLKTVTFDPNWGAAPLAVGMFQNCPALEEITLPADLAAVPEYCFYMCTSLKTVHFPQGLKSIGRKAFASCWSLQEIDLPASLELFDSSHYSLGQYYSGYACEAFAGCALTEVDLTGCPLLTEIPAGTFAANGELTVIRLGDSIRTIGDRAFSRSGMTQDYLSGDREVLYGKYTPYQYLPVAELRWPSGLTAIGDEAFLDCFLGKLSDEPFPLQLPETVKTIGSWAFAAGDHPQMFATRMYNMIVLPEGRLPSGITLLGESTFRHTAVTEIAVPEGVISIGGYCFADTPRLKAVTLPDSVTEIGDWAFSSCGITAPGNRYTLPAGLKTVGFAAFVDTPGVKHWVLPAGLELLERRAFDFGTDEDPHTLTFLNQDGGLPVIRMDDDLFSGPVTVRCYEHSAAHTWALERQAGANGENVRIVPVDDSAILRVLLLKEDGSAVGERELLSVAWYDETAGSGVLSWETSLEEGIDPTHVYRVDMITADDLRYNYLVPETLSLSVYPQNEPSVTYTLKPRERVTYSFGVAGYDNHAAAHLVTVSTSVGGITRLYSRADKNLPYDYDARRFLLELPRIETAVAVSMPGCSLLTMKHIQLLEAEDGVIDLGVLEPVYNPLALEYPLRFVDAATGKAVQPGFGGTFTLWNKTEEAEVAGIQVSRSLILPESARDTVKAGDELELRYEAADSRGHTLAEPFGFTAVDGTGEVPVLTVPVDAPVSIHIAVKGSSYGRCALFAGDGTLVGSGSGNMLRSGLAAGTYTILVWSSAALRSVTGPDDLAQLGLPEGTFLRQDVTLAPGESGALSFTAPPMPDDLLLRNLTVGLAADEAHMTASMIPVSLTFSCKESARGLPKTFTVQESAAVAGRFVEYGGAYAYLNGEPLEAEFISGGGHTRPRLVIRTDADEGTILFYARAEGQELTLNDITVGGIPFSGSHAQVMLPVHSFTFTDPAGITGEESGNLQLTYLNNEAVRALIFVDGAFQANIPVPGRAVPSTAALPYTLGESGSAGIHTLQAMIVKNSFTGGQEEWFDLVTGEDEEAYESAILAVSPAYRIVLLEETVPRPLKLTITGNNGENQNWDGVRPTETAVVDFVNQTAQKLKFVVTYWNLNEDGTIKKDYTLDYALTMEHPELVTPGSVYLDVYCGENAAEPTIHHVPLTRNPLSGDFEGTLVFPGGTITANDMPYYVYAGFGCAPSASASEPDAEYLAAEVDRAADFAREAFAAAAEEHDLFDLDLDPDMVELLLENELSSLSDADRQLIRDAVRSMKELAELERAAQESAAAGMAAVELLSNGSLSYGDCGGYTEESLLTMGAKKLETTDGTFYALLGESTTVLYDPENDLSVSLNGAAFGAGEYAELTEDLVLASLGSAAAGQAALMESADERFADSLGELNRIRSVILTLVNAVDSILDEFLAKSIAQEAALQIQMHTSLASEAEFRRLMGEMQNAMRNPGTSDAMYQELSTKLSKYHKLQAEATSAALSNINAHRKVNILKRIKGIVTGVRGGLLSSDVTMAAAAQAKATLEQLKAGILSKCKLGESAKNIFRVGGVVMCFLGLAGDLVSAVSGYFELKNHHQRYMNVDLFIQEGVDKLTLAASGTGGYHMRREVLEKHGFTAYEQHSKGVSVWLKMMGDNTEVYTDYEINYKGGTLASVGTNIANTISALAGSAPALVVSTAVGTVANATVTIFSSFQRIMDEEALDEDWEDYYEHVAGPVGFASEDGDEQPDRRKPGGSPGSGQGVHTPTAPQIDPAGYVYEAVASNRLSGVTVKAYYLKGEAETYWDDADFYNEVNPQVTDETGAFSWYTPMGKWKVRAEKEGYDPADSEADPAAADGWLPVPPPQMNVHISMVSHEAPRVEEVLASPTEVRVTFSRYMRADWLEAGTAPVTLTLDGTAAEIRCAFADLEESPAQPGVFYGRTLVLTRADGELFRGDAVEVTVDGSLESYAGTPMGANYASGPVTLQPLAGEITVLRSGSLSTDIGTLRSILLEVRDTEGQLMENAEIRAETLTGRLGLETDTVRTDENGRAVLQAAGLAGGPDTVSLRAGIAEAELDARVSVGTVVESALGVSLAARLLSGDSSGVRLTALVENVTDLPAAGALYAAAYRDGRYLGAALYPDTVTLLPGETAELPMEISCDGSGAVTLKLFFLDGETMAPLSGNQK